MKITNIKIEQKRSIGNWESLTFMAEATIEEDESAHEATTTLWNFVDWQAQKINRDAKLKVYKLVLTDPNSAPEKRVEAEKWISQYDKRKAEVEGI